MMLHGRPPSSDAWGWYTPRPRTFHPIGGRPPGSAAHLRQAHYLISRTGCSHPTPTLSTIAARPGTSSSSGPGRSCPSAYATGPMGSDQWKLVLAGAAISSSAAIAEDDEKPRRLPPNSQWESTKQSMLDLILKGYEISAVI